MSRDGRYPGDSPVRTQRRAPSCPPGLGKLLPGAGSRQAGHRKAVRPMSEHQDAPDEDVVELAGKIFDLARQGEAATLAAYLDAGVPANLTNDRGDTLVMLAAYHGHADAVTVLLERGAEADRANDRGQTPSPAPSSRARKRSSAPCSRAVPTRPPEPPPPWTPPACSTRPTCWNSSEPSSPLFPGRSRAPRGPATSRLGHGALKCGRGAQTAWVIMASDSIRGHDGRAGAGWTRRVSTPHPCRTGRRGREAPTRVRRQWSTSSGTRRRTSSHAVTRLCESRFPVASPA